MFKGILISLLHTLYKTKHKTKLKNPLNWKHWNRIIPRITFAGLQSNTFFFIFYLFFFSGTGCLYSRCWRSCFVFWLVHKLTCTKVTKFNWPYFVSLIDFSVILQYVYECMEFVFLLSVIFTLISDHFLKHFIRIWLYWT